MEKLTFCVQVEEILENIPKNLQKGKLQKVMNLVEKKNQAKQAIAL